MVTGRMRLPSNGRRTFSTLGKYLCLRYGDTLLKTSRLLHMRILLWRPSFSQASRCPIPRPEDSIFSLESQLTNSITTHCLVNCVKTAQQIIGLISGNLENQGSPSILPSYWYNIYCAPLAILAGKADTDEGRCVHRRHVIDCSTYLSHGPASRAAVDSKRIVGASVQLPSAL